MLRLSSLVFIFALINATAANFCYHCQSTSSCESPGKMDCCDASRGGCGSCVKIIEKGGNIQKGCLSDKTGIPFVRVKDSCWVDPEGKDVCACYGELCNSAESVVLGTALMIGALLTVGRIF